MKTTRLSERAWVRESRERGKRASEDKISQTGSWRLATSWFISWPRKQAIAQGRGKTESAARGLHH